MRHKKHKTEKDSLRQKDIEKMIKERKWKGCLGKVQYLSKSVAEQCGGQGLNAYKCLDCNFWHIGRG